MFTFPLPLLIIFFLLTTDFFAPAQMLKNVCICRRRTREERKIWFVFLSVLSGEPAQANIIKIFFNFDL